MRRKTWIMHASIIGVPRELEHQVVELGEVRSIDVEALESGELSVKVTGPVLGTIQMDGLESVLFEERYQ